ncbi:hypothetical protein GCM10010346_53590 [Streptomyces chryseus]|uniref:Uncharacterized protein n=1 Tax=Streptomyces chryseus TaxID=68186 RepID=A0ABQ3E918_9ACTN|nr:hypothetical protein GCM10010346_53590 [Streptomyces chryseus]
MTVAPILPARHNIWGVQLPTAPTCMLMLAVAAGESGVNPELSRNGVIGVLLRTQESEDLPTAYPARPNRVPTRPGLAVGPVDATRCAALHG